MMRWLFHNLLSTTIHKWLLNASASALGMPIGMMILNQERHTVVYIRATDVTALRAFMRDAGEQEQAAALSYERILSGEVEEWEESHQY